MRLNKPYNKFEPFTYKNLSELKAKFNELHLELPISEKLDVLKQNIRIDNIVIPNRLAIQPMEGFDAKLDGSPGELTFRRYLRYANGGAGLIWFEATAISEKCRSNPNQLMLSEKNINDFKAFVQKIRTICNKNLNSLGFKDECIFILQLNHSGRYSSLNGKRFPIKAYDNLELDNVLGVSKNDGIVINDKDLEELEDLWVQKAVLAKEAGFDGVDIKSCHGYLINDLLNARLRDNSKYGGASLENRAKLLINIIKKLKNQIQNNDEFIITTRLGIYDGVAYPNGFGVSENEKDIISPLCDLKEPLILINKLYDLGIRLINISVGNPRYNPHITRPYDIPISGVKVPSEHPLYSVYRIINLTSLIKKQIPKEMKVIGSGYSYLRQFAGYIAAGLIRKKKVDICGFGRMSFANPDFPKQLFLDGVIDKKNVCITCSKCSELMKLGKSTGCVVRDSEYKK